MKTIKILLLSAALTTFAGPVFAHHSHATIDMDDVRMYSGIVVKYGWTMPHVYLKVNAPNDKGEIVEYSIEMQHPPAMKALGWSKDTWKPGDKITWQGSHDRDKNRAYTSLRYAERSDGTRIGAEKGMTQTIDPSTDFTGLWKRSDVGGFKPHYAPPEGWNFTAVGQDMIDNFDEDDNPMVRCGNPGPPKMMIVPYPVSITRPNDTTIVMERELMSEKRTVYLDPAHAAGAPSPLGHAVGRFENDVLIVETNNFTADTWGSHTGVSSSDQKELVEKFTIGDDGLFLMAEITITDPVYLAEPITFTHRWRKLGDREVIQAPCTMESAMLYLKGGRKGKEEGSP